VFYQLMSVTGAVLVLVAFGCLQTGKLDRHSRWFNLLNFVGSMMLGAVAVHDRRWGFIGLEFIWAAFSVPPLFHKKAARST
jgi:uncharacterized membrane protein